MTHELTLATILLVTGAACAGCNDPPPLAMADAASSVPGQVNPINDVVSKLSEQPYKTLADVFGDTTPIPNSSTLKYTPDQALGLIYGKKLKPGVNKKCSEAGVDDFVADRLDTMRSTNERCVTKVTTQQDVASFRTDTKGGFNLGIGGVGSGGAEAEAVFQVDLTHPANVVFSDSSACKDADFVRKQALTPNERVCEMDYVVGAVVTQLVYRTFESVDAGVSAGFSLVNVSGHLYSQAGESASMIILTGNFEDISGMYATDPATGFLVPPKGASVAGKPSAPAVVGADRGAQAPSPPPPKASSGFHKAAVDSLRDSL